MLRKKNYKNQLHYQYHPLQIPQPNGSKLTVYFRRYKPSMSSAPQNTLYDVLKHGKSLSKQPSTTCQPEQQLASKDRTLQVITFDRPLDPLLLRKAFRLIGKVRKVEVGQHRHKNKQAYFALITFKFEFDLVKAFKSDHLQVKVNEEFRNVRVEEGGRREYMMDLVEKHGEQPDEGELRRIKELQQEGFQVVTDKYGGFQLNRESNQKFVADLPQMRKKAKPKTKRSVAKEPTQ